MWRKVLERTSSDPDPARLNRVYEYWGVKEMARKGKERRAR